MPDYVKDLLARDDVVAAGPPEPASIEAVLSRVPSKIPASLLELWRSAETVQFASIDAELLSLEAALEMAPIMSPDELGFLPVLDTHQSNYVGVMIREPLAPRVGYMPHDDGPEGMMLRYRDVDGFLQALITALDRGENADLYFYNEEGDYPLDGTRTAADLEAARALLSTDGAHGEWNWAIGLLDRTNLQEWERLLDTRREVRCDVLMRLRQMSDAAIQKLLERDEEAMQEFAEALAEAARQAGFKVGERSGSVLKVGKSGWDLDAFFSKRHRPDAIPQIVAWFKNKDESIFNEP
jgi:hypothetical protein